MFSLNLEYFIIIIISTHITDISDPKQSLYIHTHTQTIAHQAINFDNIVIIRIKWGCILLVINLWSL